MSAESRPLARAAHQVEFAIGGITCASCAARIEKTLNRLDGVSATVNYATEKASVTFPETISVEDLITTVEATGYTAVPPAAASSASSATGEQGDSGPGDELATLRRRLWTSALLAMPVIVLAMAPSWQFTHGQWLSLTLAAPVVVYGGAPFHRAAWTNLRHGAATMDTLISMGTLAAFGWSLWALFFGTAGTPGMTHPFTLIIDRRAGGESIYFEVATAVTVFILAGRFFEARAKRRASAALRALLELGAKDVTVLRDGREQRIPIDQLAIGDLFVVRPGEDRHRRYCPRWSVRGGLLDAHGRVRARRGRRWRHSGRRNRQRGRPLGRARPPDRCRHAAGSDGPAGRAGTDRQGGGPAPG